jgi:hypothetical protein
LLPSYAEDMPVTLNLIDYPDAIKNLPIDATQMRLSRTVFDVDYRSDFEHYSHFYWVSVESGALTLTFESGSQIVVYRKNNSEEPVQPGTSVVINPGDIIVMVDIVVSAFNGAGEKTTILTVGWVNQSDPAPCTGGCWLP